MRKRPVVAIVGRPNVGKSTLFNRIVGKRKAIVHEKPGMTRDRHFAHADYRMRPMTLIDTGGYEDSTESALLTQMRTQSLAAMEEADSVIFLTSLHEPNDPVDAEILRQLRTSGRPFFLAVNKCEGKMAEAQAYADFSNYGLDAIYPISALHGEGVLDLLDDVTEDFERWDPDEEEEEDGRIRIAIVGRQNVGKSTLLNRLFGSERVIANPLAGTTRDAIDADITVNGKDYLLIDTAGIRRRGRIERGPEKLSVHSSFSAIDRAHVVLLVLDATEGITSQDTHIAGYILERRRACALVLNKWDLVEQKAEAYSAIIREVRDEFNFMPWAPILTISAITGQRTHKIWDLVERCAANFQRRFPTRELNGILKRATSYLSPPIRKGKTPTIKYVTQTTTMPPVLSLFVNDPELFHFSYRRFLTNQFYESLGLEGTPLILRFRRKAPPRGWERHIGSGEKEPPRVAADGAHFAKVYDNEGEEFALEIDLSEVADMDAETYGKYYDTNGEEDE